MHSPGRVEVKSRVRGMITIRYKMGHLLNTTVPDTGFREDCRFSFTSRLLLLISEHLHVPVTSRNVP